MGHRPHRRPVRPDNGSPSFPPIRARFEWSFSEKRREEGGKGVQGPLFALALAHVPGVAATREPSLFPENELLVVRSETGRGMRLALRVLKGEGLIRLVKDEVPNVTRIKDPKGPPPTMAHDGCETS